jgi:hypothetical protein
MSKQYDNLAEIHADGQMVANYFMRLLNTPHSPKTFANSRVLAACIRLSSSEQNLEYVGTYVRRQSELDVNLLQSIPRALIEDPNVTTLAKFVIRACKHSRIPLTT